MAKITYRKINNDSWLNNTFLAPYYGYIVKLIEYKNGRKDIWIDGFIMRNIEGVYITEYNEWRYSVKKLLGHPLKLK